MGPRSLIVKLHCSATKAFNLDYSAMKLSFMMQTNPQIVLLITRLKLLLKKKLHEHSALSW